MSKLNLDIRQRMLNEGWPRHLESFFKRTTTFNIRHGIGRIKDKIAPGVYKDEFLIEFSRGELKNLIAGNLVEEGTFSRANGRRKYIAFIDYAMPQVDPMKKRVEILLATPMRTWVTRIFLFLCLVGFLVSIALKRVR